MRDLLVSYLLGELGGPQQRQLEERIRNSPELQRELAYLRSCFLAAGTEQEPPSGLAERTAGRINDLVCGSDGSCLSEAWIGAPASRSVDTAPVDAPAYAPSWSMADLTVAAGVFMAVTMLFVPALRGSRDMARRNDCQDHMRQLGTMLAGYADQHNGYFPRVAPTENAGIFAARLVNEGYASGPEMVRLLVCRASPLADLVRTGHVVVQIPNVAQLRIIQRPDLAVLRSRMGGSYAYRLGYVQGGKYFDIRNQQLERSPLLADTPSLRLADFKSANHGGCGQNVLYQDQSVRYQTDCTVPGLKDHLFLNTAGLPAAGQGPDDAVLGRSEATPGILPIARAPVL